MTEQLQPLSLSSIRLDGGTQLRVALNDEAIAEYADLIRNSGPGVFPPVVVFDDGSDRWLADGFHRYYAHEAAGASLIMADVRLGTRKAAVGYAAGANEKHGVRRSNDDKRKAVMALLADEDWRGESDRVLAEVAGVSDEMVRKLRSQVPTVGTCPQVPGTIDEQIGLAARPGVFIEAEPETTVVVERRRGRPKKAEVDAEVQEPPVEKRRGRDGKMYPVRPKKPGAPGPGGRKKKPAARTRHRGPPPPPPEHIPGEQPIERKKVRLAAMLDDTCDAVRPSAISDHERQKLGKLVCAWQKSEWQRDRVMAGRLPVMLAGVCMNGTDPRDWGEIADALRVALAEAERRIDEQRRDA